MVKGNGRSWELGFYESHIPDSHLLPPNSVSAFGPRGREVHRRCHLLAAAPACHTRIRGRGDLRGGPGRLFPVAREATSPGETPPETRPAHPRRTRFLPPSPPPGWWDEAAGENCNRSAGRARRNRRRSPVHGG